MSLRNHIKFTVEVISYLVDGMNQRSVVGDKGRHQQSISTTGWSSTAEIYNPCTIGEAHKPLERFGFKVDQWEIFGETMVDELLRREEISTMPGAAKAWIAFIG